MSGVVWTDRPVPCPDCDGPTVHEVKVVPGEVIPVAIRCRNTDTCGWADEFDLEAA